MQQADEMEIVASVGEQLAAVVAAKHYVMGHSHQDLARSSRHEGLSTAEVVRVRVLMNLIHAAIFARECPVFRGVAVAESVP